MGMGTPYTIALAGKVALWSSIRIWGSQGVGVCTDRFVVGLKLGPRRRLKLVSFVRRRSLRVRIKSQLYISDSLAQLEAFCLEFVTQRRLLSSYRFLELFIHIF
jgi:hypothetical protein